MVHDKFNPPVVAGVSCPLDEDMAKQEFKAECDINVIMSKALRQGVFPEGTKVGRYGDFSEIGDYQEALATVANANQQFAGLPAKVRDRFHNNPAEFLDWVQNKANLDEANDLGLLSDEAVKRIIAARETPKPPA